MDIQGHAKIQEALRASNVWADVVPRPTQPEQDVRFVTVTGENPARTKPAEILNALGELVVQPGIETEERPAFRVVGTGLGEVTLEDLKAPLSQPHTGPSIR